MSGVVDQIESVAQVARTAPRTACSPCSPTSSDATTPSRVRELERERDELRSQAFHLERLSQAGVLAGGLVHDMRNLLAAISGTCQIALIDCAAKPHDVYEHVNQLALQAADAMKVFLTFVRKTGPTAASCRVEDAVTDAGRFLAPVLKTTRVTLVRRVEQGLSVVGERTLLLQVLVNLIQNSVRAIGDEPGRVEITASRTHDGVTIDVRDDGPGMPEAVRARLFEAFATGNGASGGSGLGLHTARRIVEQLGGSLSLVSTGPDGTTFRLRLRADPCAPRATPQSCGQEALR